MNLLEPSRTTSVQRKRGLLHEFGVVRLYQTLSNYIFTGGTSLEEVRGGSRLLVRRGSETLNHPELM